MHWPPSQQCVRPYGNNPAPSQPGIVSRTTNLIYQTFRINHSTHHPWYAKNLASSNKRGVRRTTMKRPPVPELSRRERQIMDVVYRLDRASADQVRRQLPDPPSYSAVRAL